MTQSRLVKVSGWAFIAAGLCFLAVMKLSDQFAVAILAISSILIAVGMLGLRARSGANAGGLGGSILLLGVIGMVLLYLLMGGMALLYSGVLPVAQYLPPPIAYPLGIWILFYGGPAIVLLALTLFGALAVRSDPAAWWGWLPVLAGIWYPLFYYFLAFQLFSNYGIFPEQYLSFFYLMFVIQTIALCGFGVVLVRDTGREMVTA